MPTPTGAALLPEVHFSDRREPQSPLEQTLWGAPLKKRHHSENAERGSEWKPRVLSLDSTRTTRWVQHVGGRTLCVLRHIIVELLPNQRACGDGLR